MNEGRIEQLGATWDIYHKPRTSFVASFLGKANILPTTRIAQEGPLMRVRLAGEIELLMEDPSPTSGATEIIVAIRPEKIHLRKSAPAGDNTFQALVIDEIFRGAMDELSLRTNGELTLAVIVANESATQESFHKGEKVFCSIDPSDIVLIRPE